ncbi:TetR/AcrR family transcriptional regulator [Streptomyces zagrosensis]|uniref:AcrR family transcriptional regulator n=1 Tax=Streptomyces zagrosensis TaxID=1042984 RepID=A0A7W9QEI6_9ACTN|nr:TetR/AcrR family transcriptional regulator [Streptomyces zagrosensis]MBB5937767.1 AcrR family transcriptional regulator [Streptomyces zagrosensis]
MSEVSSPQTAGAGAPRGRIDKRHAILGAAFTVFAREGYGQACVRVIAAEAGVAKPTVYNHLGDKENLFRHAMEAAGARALTASLAVVAELRAEGATADDAAALSATLEDVGYRLLLCSCDERSWALRRLLYAEVGKFPELLDSVWGHGTHRVQEALADRFARLTLAGRLHTADPAQAAEQFFALLTGPMEARSRLGTRPVSDAEAREVARAAVRTFLRAFGPGPDETA